jgi:hypothetical protein
MRGRSAAKIGFYSAAWERVSYVWRSSDRSWHPPDPGNSILFLASSHPPISTSSHPSLGFCYYFHHLCHHFVHSPKLCVIFFINDTHIHLILSQVSLRSHYIHHVFRSGILSSAPLDKTVLGHQVVV